jgi:anti-sigma factor RsiW
MTTLPMDDQFIPRLSEYLDGELPADEAHLVQVHAAGCVDCANTLTELRKVVGQLHASADEPLLVPPPDVWRRVLPQLDQWHGAPHGTSISVSTQWPRRTLMAGLFFLLGLLAGVWLGAAAQRSKNGAGPGWMKHLVPGFGCVSPPPTNTRYLV